MENVIVQKFGGSSVADTDKIKKIAQMVVNTKKAGFNVVVVVSAMGKTTNNLIELAKSIAETPDSREMDMLLSTGERITMSLLCMAIKDLGEDAVSLTGSQAGIITNDVHNNAKIIEVRPFRVEDELLKNKIVVVGGFQGVSYKRDITTLGRGGSDTSAVALAAALDAIRCEIYSDIDGVYTADPNVIKEAKHLPEISYDVMQEMATWGAKVLNADAVQFAKEKNIAIYARSTFSREKETIIRKLPNNISSGIKTVAIDNNILIIFIPNSYDILNKTIEFLNINNIEVKEISTTVNEIKVIINTQNLYNINFVKEFQNYLGINIKSENISAVSLFGEGISRELNILKELYTNFGKDIKYLSLTTLRYTIFTDKEKSPVIADYIHKKWIE
ncbi:MAG TPA: aspartate kinase [Ignavibacteriales bacterium]|nr:aspartate kinase [Ignavibacteriales bacterium]HPD67336.1 aspartate kinase [Ignavibacteriales bacterium]HRR19425.1 aspartate kinase [Ignavibacteriales bacterium]HRT99842.1 aspartate kinase [Ignavibacteriales bacterium]